MIPWLLISLCVVFAVRYLTAVQLRNLQRRLDAASTDLEKSRGRLNLACEDMRRVRLEEERVANQNLAMSQTIEDLTLRLQARHQDEMAAIR